MTKAIVDLETHVTDFAQDTRWTRGHRKGSLVQDWGDLCVADRILMSCFDSGHESGVSLMTIANCDDYRAQEFATHIADYCRGYWRGMRYEDIDNGLWRISSPEKRQAYFLVGEERETNHGHIVFSGIPYDQRLSSNVAAEVLREARDRFDAVAVCDYDASLFERVGGRIVNIFADSQKASMVAGPQFIADYYELIDAVKGKAGTRLPLEIQDVPILAVSDSHRPEGFGKYGSRIFDGTGPFSQRAVFENLDFGSREKLVRSLRSSLRRGTYENVFSRRNIFEDVRHGLTVLGGVAAKKLWLMKQESVNPKQR